MSIDGRKAAREIVGRKPRPGIGHIGAHIGELPHAQREKFSALVEREFAVGDVVAALIVGGERFRARRHPVHRLAGEPRGGDQRGIFRIDAGFHAEGAADIFGQHADLALLAFEEIGQCVADNAGALRTGAQGRDIRRRIVPGGGPARLHRGDDQTLIHNGDARDMRRFGEGVVDRFLARGRIGGRSGPVDGDIAGHVFMHLRRAGFHRVAHIGDRGR